MEITDKLVSVIVPIYNVEKYVKGTIKSILNQKYSLLEIILIDDGSTDSSGRICDQFKDNPRCTVIHQSNLGLSSARNKGLSIAHGEYISFVDGDDIIHPQMIETLVSILENHPMIDLSMITFKKTHEVCSCFDSVILQEPIIIKHNELFYHLFNEASSTDCILFNVVWNKLYRREIIGDLLFDSSINEDLVFIYRYYLKTRNLSFLPVELYFWMQREDSLSHVPNFELNVRRLMSFESCVINTPSIYHWEKAICLKRLYKNILSSRKYLPKKDQSKLSEIAHTHMKEFMQSQNSVLFKMACLLFLSFPWSYSLFLKIIEFNSRLFH